MNFKLWLFGAGRRFLTAVFFLIASHSLFARDIEIIILDSELGIPLEEVRVYSADGSYVKGDEDGRLKLKIKDNETPVFRIIYPGYETLRWTVPEQGESWILSLKAVAAVENKELLFEANRSSQIKENLGDSITLSSKVLSKSARIGLIEDVLTSIKLLPGVSYTGMFDALPSIRGGEPGDLKAVFDGFYIDNPYHWGGVVSIFDPKMVETATLSHGVFQTRYGYSSSGLLEVESKHAARDYAEIETGISTSALHVYFSTPLKTKDASQDGGFSFFGKITYWDGFVGLVKLLSNSIEAFDVIDAVKTAPYIQCAGFNFNYRWSSNLEAIINAYTGNDGVEIEYKKGQSAAAVFDNEMEYSWNNLIAFFSTQINFNPLNNLLLRSSLGGSFNKSVYSMLLTESDGKPLEDKITYPVYNGQFRFELDWQAAENFVFNAGVEEVYHAWQIDYKNNIYIYLPNGNNNMLISYPLYSPDVNNQGWFSSAWTALNYESNQKKISAEAGIRIDHLYFINTDFNAAPPPVFNPRFNIKYHAFSGEKIESLTLSAGSGLFSSITNELTLASSKNALSGIKQQQAWTNVLGINAAFNSSLSANVEFYYKYVFNRTYSNIVIINDGSNQVGNEYYFDGRGHVGGIDILLQKKAGRATGWISYSFNIARYNNPEGTRAFPDAAIDSNEWYYPQYHRFHNLNLILNLKLFSAFSLFTRLGFASGVPLIEHNKSRPLLYIPTGTYRYYDYSRYSDTLRNVYSIPLDIKLSYNFYKKNGKTQGEVYIAIGNALVMIMPKNDTRVMNSYTGALEEPKDKPLYELPVPMVSFGFRWMY
ncbi:MAG: hypothetical protein LBG79_08950 [Spirochaetaceae bacterium]|nr:hypothetical protein [Spirochaetaceae bacterium]